jgi:metallophosphoesterase superfamily enzyme
MKSIEERLSELFDEYQPRRFIIVGDLVHDGASVGAAKELLGRLREHCEVVAVAGNHDCHVAQAIEFVPRWETPSSCSNTVIAPSATDRIQVIGHHHPTATVRDGADWG